MIQNLLQHAVIIDGLTLPPPTELEPYEWTDIPADFGQVRGFGGAVPYVVTALDGTFQITCKPTDAAYAFLAHLRATKKAAALAGGVATFTLTHLRGDTGETWVGTECTFADKPGMISKEQPTAVTWTINAAVVAINPPTLNPLVA